MKTMISSLLVTMILLVACNKEQFTPQEPLSLKKEKFEIPMKADFFMTPDFNFPGIQITGMEPNKPGSILPGRIWMSGQSTLVGELNTKESYSILQSAKFHYPLIEAQWEGRVTGANGEYFMWSATTFALPDNSFTGEFCITCCNGKFKGAAGRVMLTGTGMRWTAEGTMTYNN